MPVWTFRSRALAAIACLMGAGGVTAAAAAAHITGEGRMSAAAQILMVHAAATLALAASGATASRLVLLGTVGLQAGAILFAADMAARTILERALFPSAAPIGGTVLILAWLGAAAGFAFRSRSTGQ